MFDISQTTEVYRNQYALYLAEHTLRQFTAARGELEKRIPTDDACTEKDTLETVSANAVAYAQRALLESDARKKLALTRTPSPF